MWSQSQIKYFNQEDPQWNEEEDKVYYEAGNSYRTLAASGCGFTSIAMAVSTLQSTYINPVYMFRKLINLPDCYDTTNGMHQQAVIEAGKIYNLSTEKLYSKLAIKLALQNNDLVIFGADGPSCLTGVGHVVLIYGMETIDGVEYFCIADPNMNNTNYTRSGHSYAVKDTVKDDGFVKVQADYLMSHFVQATKI